MAILSLFSSTSPFIHPQLLQIVAKMTLLDTLLFYVVHFVDKLGIWHRLPVLLGLAYLGIRRHLHQRYNLLHVGGTYGRRYNTDEFAYRTADGTCNHPTDDTVDSQGTFFGRNMPPSTSRYGLLEPHPTVVASELLARKKFIDNGEQFNMIACSWIQFMIHDWIDHLEDTEQVHYSDLDDEQLYRHARLVTSAVIAKIHTIDWTVELLRTDTLLAGMRINWYGFLGKKFKDTFGHILGPILSGLVGLRKPIDHGVPYSLTEEFVSVYRMHSLLPDKFFLRDITYSSTSDQDKCPPVLEEVPMRELVGTEGERKLSMIGMEQMLVSMGHQACGAITLWNYPSWMRNLVAHDINGEDRPDQVDMATMEIYRDRERGVARYNEFRRNLLMIPLSKWEDLTDDSEVVEALHEVYGDDVEKLDLLVGLHAEKKIKGFAISETAFFIFLLIASRRLEADRFFTTNFNCKSYTEKGLEWVNKTETLKDVIDRHFPEMTRKWMKCSSAFSVWGSMPNPTNHIPLYLRPAT
ncbi:alpha-dioxygenase 2-like isoform X4 [Carya illinoinensis]|uniref:alpha-dioxygenase 2-like isoform X4 n=1 Tax=Carya illinoinensis TaxID=32201 RepID=UPI001C7243C5|nr:alpha-dioxygenase 2-like isoform X4 [Carya illinoinensis]